MCFSNIALGISVIVTAHCGDYGRRLRGGINQHMHQFWVLFQVQIVQPTGVKFNLSGRGMDDEDPTTVRTVLRDFVA